jgi:hypothetical protein
VKFGKDSTLATDAIKKLDHSIESLKLTQFFPTWYCLFCPEVQDCVTEFLQAALPAGIELLSGPL